MLNRLVIRRLKNIAIGLIPREGESFQVRSRLERRSHSVYHCMNRYEITCVNGELCQRARLAEIFFDIHNIIATGTPGSVGMLFSPPPYLQPGDEVVVDIGGVGRLVNRVAQG